MKIFFLVSVNRDEIYVVYCLSLCVCVLVNSRVRVSSLMGLGCCLYGFGGLGCRA